MDYAKAVTNAATALKTQRLLLDEDVQRYVVKAGESGIGK